MVEAVQAQTGIELDRRKLHLDEPIKTLGTHQVPVKLHTDVEFAVTSRSSASCTPPPTAWRRLRRASPLGGIHRIGPDVHRVIPRRVP